MTEYSHAGFLARVEDHFAEPTARHGIAWPKRPLERWVLAWLECKADHFYQWPRWAVAEEVTDATYAFYERNNNDNSRAN